MWMWQSVIIQWDSFVSLQLLAAANTARLVKTRIISRRYSGVSADVVRGLAVRAAASAADSAKAASMVLPINISPARLASIVVGFTVAVAMRAPRTGPLDR